MRYLFLILLFASCQTATTWELGPFEKITDVNPILRPSSDYSFLDPISSEIRYFEEKNVLNPSAVVKDGLVHLIYRAQDSLMTSRLALATSSDGIHFEKSAEPILFPEGDEQFSFEWPGGIEDPRVVSLDQGGYYLTYTAYDGKTARLFAATSPDLIHWEKLGSVFENPVYADIWSKSGALVTTQIEDQFVATKIDGYYYMYFGDTSLFIARSTDLESWEVLEDGEKQTPLKVLNPRPGYFDSRLVEPGPFAVLKPDGVVLIYNASNAKGFNNSDLPDFTYSAGQALFDANEPWKLIDRTDEHFIAPESEFEKIGEVNQVVFVEGLVYYKGSYFLYYGTADSKIGVAKSR
jgi:predicted GH43/DUF377 family glycosyl hydrolase